MSPGTHDPWVTEPVAPGDGEHLLVRRFRLEVVSGQDAQKSFVSEGARAIVGTDASADVALADRTVSRFHCEIAVRDGRVVLRDLGSTNGVVVDGVPVYEAPLRDGATLGIGRTEIRFTLGEGHAKVPISAEERFGLLVGRAPAMRAAFAALERVAPTDSTVLLEGETGTGKEAAAESIHRASPRCDGPFLVVDCGALPATLLESELFGHERGAFTGAVAAREGAFEAASGGTIFLDEIGELAPDLQPKLLRVLESRQVKRLGAERHEAVDVRVVAATNRNLREAINAGTFRPDLYYRLAVVEIRLPPLRERREDLPRLVEHLLERLGATERAPAAGLSGPAFLATIERHAWPGNVRELRNYLERCLVLQERAPFESPPASGSPAVDVRVPLKTARARVVDGFERRYLEEILAAHSGNVTAAARAAGVDRITFYRLLWRHGLRSRDRE